MLVDGCGTTTTTRLGGGVAGGLVTGGVVGGGLVTGGVVGRGLVTGGVVGGGIVGAGRVGSGTAGRAGRVGLGPGVDASGAPAVLSGADGSLTVGLTVT